MEIEKRNISRHCGGHGDTMGNNMNHHYRLRYDLKIEPGTFTKADANGKGLTDSLILISMLYPADGSYSQAMVTNDGKGDPLSANEIWKAWAVLTSALASRKDLHESKRELCELVMETIRGGLENARG